MRVYYYFPLHFSYRSGQTIQVIQDYVHLARRGYEVCLFGTYDSEEELEEIRQDIGTAPVRLLLAKGDKKWKRNWLRCRFLAGMLAYRKEKYIISRNLNKIREALFFRPLMGPSWTLLERHEDAIPYFIKARGSQEKERHRWQRTLSNIDSLILTNYSQLEILQKEFTFSSHVVLPNSVDIAHFSTARPGPVDGPYTITYAGQFTSWKNPELLFQALTYLDSRFSLRIAGGKGDQSSLEWIQNRTQLYGLEGRVDYRGFVPRNKLVEQVFSGSSILALPLGDNWQSRYFTSPLKLFEYMATPIPVVAVDYPSIRLLTGENTVFLSANNPQTFAQTLSEAVSSPHTPARVREMNELVKRYSHEERAKRFDEHLQHILK